MESGGFLGSVGSEAVLFNILLRKFESPPPLFSRKHYSVPHSISYFEIKP
jgi:hypothetical protein